jgi:hypothetical protein
MSTHARPEPTDDEQALAALLKRIDALCAELQDTREPINNVEAGVQLVVAGGDSAEVASNLRAASHARELREAILKVAIEQLAKEAAALDFKIKDRRPPTWGNQIRNWDMAPGSAAMFIHDVYARELALEVARRSEEERSARYDRALVKYKRLRGEHEHLVGSRNQIAFEPITAGMTDEEMADLNPPGQIKEGYTVTARRAGKELPV